MKFIKKLFLENLVLVTGTHTSGKSMVSPIIASLKKVDILKKIYNLDQIAVLNYFDKIDFDTASYLAKQILDYNYYEQLIGRNVNFRYSDETSVYQSKNPEEFFSRIFGDRGEKILDLHKKKNTHMLVDTHDGIWFYNFWNNLGIKNLKIINVYRNPIDIVNSWINLDLGIIEKNKLCQIPIIESNNRSKIFYNFRNLKKNYNKYEIAVKMVNECYTNEVNSFNSIKNKNKIFRVNFDDFAQNTKKIISQIEIFLKINKTKFTKEIMIKERLPRIIDPQERVNKENKIKKLVRKQIFEELKKLESFHHKNDLK
jgi:hypothetical protein